MKLVLVFFLFGFVTTSSAQNSNEKKLFETFKTIVKSDQLNIHNNYLRDSLILNNFKTIKSLLSDGISLYPREELRKKTCEKLYTGLTITFIHVLQIDPSLLLNDETIDLFAKYINEKLIRNEELKTALLIYQTDIEANKWPNWTAYYLQRMPLAKEKWGIKD